MTAADSVNINEVLQQLHAVTLQAVSLLEGGDPDPDQIVELMERRSTHFEALQGVNIDLIANVPEDRALVEELMDLDRRCIAMAQKHLSQLRSQLNQVQLQRRSLTAYGWVDPENAPRGAFLDTTLD